MLDCVSPIGRARQPSGPCRDSGRVARRRKGRQLSGVISSVEMSSRSAPASAGVRSRPASCALHQHRILGEEEILPGNASVCTDWSIRMVWPCLRSPRMLSGQRSRRHRRWSAGKPPRVCPRDDRSGLRGREIEGNCARHRGELGRPQGSANAFLAKLFAPRKRSASRGNDCDAEARFDHAQTRCAATDTVNCSRRPTFNALSCSSRSTVPPD